MEVAMGRKAKEDGMDYKQQWNKDSGIGGHSLIDLGSSEHRVRRCLQAGDSLSCPYLLPTKGGDDQYQDSHFAASLRLDISIHSKRSAVLACQLTEDCSG
jgi:hypothetical protein